MVRLVLDDGKGTEVVTREEGLQRAQAQELDLVEVAPDADPPVCKLLDYGKFKYRQKKRTKQTHRHPQAKTIRIGPKSEEHDLNFKADRVREFLGEQRKVLITMRLAGRQIAHGQMALEHVKEFGGRFMDIAKIERDATRESAGRISMLLTPK